MTDYEKLLIIVHSENLIHADAIVLLEGDGFNRINHAAQLYKDGFANKLVFSGGVTNYDYGSYPFENCLDHLLESGVNKDDIVFESQSQHTGQQSEFVCRLAVANGWEKLILVATPHHQCRAYLTFVKQAIKHNLIIINSCAKWNKYFCNDGWGDRIDLIELEHQRIDTYTKNGDLATASEALEYQKWKDLQL